MEDKVLPKINTERRSDLVYKVIYKEIVSGKFPPGYRMDLNEIEKQLGISRTPLKLALYRLEIEGLIEIRPQYGTFVTRPNLQQISESFEVRIMVETFIISSVIERMGEDDFRKLSKIIDELNSLEESHNQSEGYIKFMELDRHFHRSFVGLSGNSSIIKIYDNTNVYPHITRLLYQIKDRDIITARKEHNTIIKSLRERDVEGTLEAVTAHCRRSKQSALNALKHYNGN